VLVIGRVRDQLERLTRHRQRPNSGSSRDAHANLSVVGEMVFCFENEQEHAYIYTGMCVVHRADLWTQLFLRPEACYVPLS
jgi:hypothetical protein